MQLFMMSRVPTANAVVRGQLRVPNDAVISGHLQVPIIDAALLGQQQALIIDEILQGKL